MEDAPAQKGIRQLFFGVGGDEDDRAVLGLYGEAVKSARDAEFNSRLLDLIEKLRVQVPVLSLACLPEKSAVECVLQNNERMTL